MWSLYSNPDSVFNDISTPKTSLEYMLLARDSLDKVEPYLNSTGWSVLYEDVNGVKIEEKKREKSSYTAIKTSTTLDNVDVNGIIKCLFNPTFEERKRIYPKIFKHQNIHTVNDNIVVSVTCFSTPFVISDREFLGARFKRVMANGDVVISVVPINKKGHHKSSCVRGVASSDIYVEKLSPSKVKITSVNWVDPKGWVSADIVQKYKQNSGDWMVKLGEVYQLL